MRESNHGALAVGLFLGLTLLPVGVTGPWGRTVGVGLLKAFGAGAWFLPVLGLGWALAAFERLGRLSGRGAALLGAGDMLYLPAGTGLAQRVHGAFVGDHEVHRVVDHLKSLASPEYIEGVLDAGAGDSGAPDGASGEGAEKDALYDQAVEIVLRTRRPSISLVQRHLRIGYNRAARLIEDMERAGLVSAMQSNGNREVLVPAKAE